MRKIVLYIALSLDGYVADSSGGIGWLGGQKKDYQGDYGYSKFIADIDTVVMGYTTYKQVSTELSPASWVYTGMSSYVLTHRKIPNTNGIKFVNKSANELVAELQRQEGKAIWICGGANIINQLIDEDLIDEYHLTIMPVLLGSGIALFKERKSALLLEFISSTSENGVLDCVYRRR